MTDAQPGRQVWCEWEDGHYFTSTGKRRPKWCPVHKPMATRKRERERKAAYGECWKCGKHKPLNFDRLGPIEPDFLVPACFCGAWCWANWWGDWLDEMLAAGFTPGPGEGEPSICRRIREARESGKMPGDYRPRKHVPKGGNAEDNELPVDPADFAWLTGLRRKRSSRNTWPSGPETIQH